MPIRQIGNAFSLCRQFILLARLQNYPPRYTRNKLSTDTYCDTIIKYYSRLGDRFNGDDAT